MLRFEKCSLSLKEREGDLKDGNMVLRHDGRLVVDVKGARMTARWHQDLLRFQTLTESEAG